MNQQITDAVVSAVLAVTLATWPPAITAMAAWPILGIPLTGLAAAMLGSGFSYLRREREKAEAVPLRMFGIAADAFIGGWIAVFVFHVLPERYGVRAVPIEATAGLCAFLMQVARKEAATYFDRAFQAALTALVSWFSKGKQPSEPDTDHGDTPP